jgi:hypothetical protein
VTAGNPNVATAVLAIPAGQAAGSYGIQATYTDTTGAFAGSSGSGTLTINATSGSSSSSGSATSSPSSSSTSSPPSQFQALLDLFFDGFQLVLAVLFGQNTSGIQASINANLPFAGPFGPFFLLSGELAAFNALSGKGSSGGNSSASSNSDDP